MKIQMVKISELNTDPSYQRDLDMARVSRLVKAFCAGAMKAISVSKRKCGRLYVYDGQHTVAAARELGIDSVPAVVVLGDQISEAQWFLAINDGGSKRVSQRQVQKAGVVADDELSKMAQDVLDSYSLTISTGGLRAGHTNAIAAIKRYLRTSPPHLRSAMDAIYSLWHEDPCAWSAVLLRGMFETARVDGQMVAVISACRRKKISPRRIMDVASAMQAATGSPGGGSGHAHRAILQLCGIKAAQDRGIV